MKYSFAVVILMTSVSQCVFAQTLCETIIKSANYNQFQSVAQNQQYSLQKANFCLADYDKASGEQKAQIEASYNLFSGSVSGSQSQIRERQHQECDNKYGEYWFNQLGLINQKVVSDKAMETVAKCIQAYIRGLKVEPTLSESEEALSVILTWTNANDLPFRGIIKAPSTNISCKLDGKDTDTPSLFDKRVIKPGTSVTFTCERSPKSEIISGEKVQCLPSVLIAIDVLENPVTLNLFRRCETDYLVSRADDVDRKVAALSKKYDALKNDLLNGSLPVARANRADKISNLKSNCIWHPITTHNSFICPEREFVAGLCFTNRDAGCPNGIPAGNENMWAVAGAILCCSID